MDSHHAARVAIIRPGSKRGHGKDLFWTSARGPDRRGFCCVCVASCDLLELQKRVSVKRSYGRVTGVGHTSLSSASIRSGEIIIPIKCGTKGRPSPILGSARGALSTPGTGGVGSPVIPRGWHLMISPLCICRRCGRDGCRGRCRKACMRGTKARWGRVKFRVMFHKSGKKFGKFRASGFRTVHSASRLRRAG